MLNESLNDKVIRHKIFILRLSRRFQIRIFAFPHTNKLNAKLQIDEIVSVVLNCVTVDRSTDQQWGDA